MLVRRLLISGIIMNVSEKLNDLNHNYQDLLFILMICPCFSYMIVIVLIKLANSTFVINLGLITNYGTGRR